MPQRVADYFVIAGLDFANPHSLRLPGENHNQGKLWFDYDSFSWLIDKINYNSKSCMVPHIVSISLSQLGFHRSYGVMVSTQDSESCDPSSSLGRTSFYINYHVVHVDFAHIRTKYLSCTYNRYLCFKCKWKRTSPWRLHYCFENCERESSWSQSWKF